ncbi:hypothetical protein [Mycobacterium sp. 1245805.9]|uniref:hypothetical protein n=1 Tax=Mycobacterium sp. 1245805.9 TaxID=1856862 RepID=UPI000801812B|nr:hypothetical protein [Mycobacterium sp. 1245805.9]OBI94298.1 hypothetical protein A9X00_13260 [Mycobacterium sp. 1245805.9]
MRLKARAPVSARFVAAGLLLAGWAASAGVAGADPEPTPPPAPGPGPKTTIDHDGTYAVGSDIAPGIYSSAGPVGNGTCYWKRTSNPDGNLVDNAMSKKPQVVQIDPGDKSFKTTGCQPWQLTPDAAVPPSAPPAGVQGTLGILNGLLGGQNGQQPPHS